MKPHPSEKQIQQTVDEFMVLDGWRVIVTDPPHLRGLAVQEEGICDRLFLRYSRIPVGPGSEPIHAALASGCQALWIEHKRKGGKAGAKQKAWHAQERTRGGLVIVAGEDFDASVDGFLDWYAKSGLARVVNTRRATAAEALHEKLNVLVSDAETA